MITINNVQYLTFYLTRKTLLKLYELTKDSRINTFIKQKYGYVPVSLLALVESQNEYLITLSNRLNIYINNCDIYIYTPQTQIHFELESGTLFLRYAYLTNIHHVKRIVLATFYSYFSELLKKEIRVKKETRVIQFKNQTITLPFYIKCTVFHKGVYLSI